VPLLIADEATVLNDKNKGSYPTENYATIEGAITKSETKLAEETVGWSIRNGDSRIPIILPKDAKPPKSGSKVRATGKVRVIEGQLLLDAIKLDPATK